MADKAPEPARNKFKPYPAKRYHATKAPVYVQDEAADKALGPGWSARPAAAPKAKE